ncbi:LacI family transcriptional regulator [Bombiscardovia coagulans]|uniref:LacI family transcriptional regulator n=2 Tax=Bombiscardovia coagulans TaxID=686666 RepID=A0A261EPW5_9BIFI|nr:LacI family transcriptional regulator [Bombiscardovia coagulans]
MVRVTLHEVAQEAGVSDSTVSRALRGLDKVDEGTRERVRLAAERLHFSISRNASSLASGKTMRVSVLFADKLNTWFDSSVLQGVYEVLFREQYDIIPNTVSTYGQLQSFFDRLPADNNVDAVIVTSINLEPGQTKVLERLTIPTVGLDSRTIDGFDASVLLNDRKGMHEAVSLLQRFGHRRIAFVGQPAPGEFKFSSQLRGTAFVQEARLAGYGDQQIFRFDTGKIADYRTYDEAVNAAAAQVLSLAPMPTAICVETDDFAVPLMASLRHYGIRIPEDLSIIGFDDANIAAAADLTTIHQNPEDMSRTAAHKTLALMRGEILEERHTMIEPILMLRGSTARYVPKAAR